MFIFFFFFFSSRRRHTRYIGDWSSDVCSSDLTQWFVAHREPWLTTAMQAVTQLGGSTFLLPLILVVGVALRRWRRTWAPLGLLVAAHLGAVALYDIIDRKSVV